MVAFHATWRSGIGRTGRGQSQAARRMERRMATDGLPAGKLEEVSRQLRLSGLTHLAHHLPLLPAIRFPVDLEIDGKLDGNEFEKSIKKLGHHQKTGVNGEDVIVIDIMAVKRLLYAAGNQFL